MNILPILVAAIVAFIIGFLWYGPVFGNYWITLKEMPAEAVQAMKDKGMGPMVPYLLGALVIQVITAAVMQFLIGTLGITTVMQASMLAGAVWLGFVAPTLFSQVLWEGRKIKLYMFDAVYHLVVLKAIAITLLLMQ